MAKVYVPWKEVEDFIKMVANNYITSKIRGVYGLPRGGLTLAVMLSHEGNIPLLAAPCKDCIIIDDICDSGESLLHYHNNSSKVDNKPNYHIVTMYYKENKLGIQPEYWYKNKGEDWIVFPWEMEKED